MGAFVDFSSLVADLLVRAFPVVVMVKSPLGSCMGRIGRTTAAPQPLFHRIGVHEGAHG